MDRIRSVQCLFLETCKVTAVPLYGNSWGQCSVDLWRFNRSVQLVFLEIIRSVWHIFMGIIGPMLCIFRGNYQISATLFRGIYRSVQWVFMGSTVETCLALILFRKRTKPFQHSASSCQIMGITAHFCVQGRHRGTKVNVNSIIPGYSNHQSVGMCTSIFNTVIVS